MVEDICILIPTLNEAATIESVINDFKEEGFSNILVIDGGSTDKTVKIAENAGADVVKQRWSGKGQAVQQAVYEEIDSEYIVMIDGDGTYEPSQVHRLITPLEEGYDQVIGNRFADMKPSAMTKLNRLGNRLINWMFYLIHRSYSHDILSGYRAFKKQSLEKMKLKRKGFGIETEMAIEAERLGLDTKVVPITYKPRPRNSQTSLHPVRDGFVIFKTLYSLAKRSNPILYFGWISILIGLISLVIGGYVGIEWVLYHQSHQVYAVLSGVLLLFSLQLFMFAVIADLVTNLHNDQMEDIQEVKQEIKRIKEET